MKLLELLAIALFFAGMCWLLVEVIQAVQRAGMMP